MSWLINNYANLKVENEYGSFYACDREYTSELRDIFRKYLGDDVVFYSTGKLACFFILIL